MPEPLQENVYTSRDQLLNWKELWKFRELVYFFTWRDVKVKYKQTLLGFSWAVLQPLLLMIVMTFFFGKTLSIQSGSLPYPVYVFSGLLLWNAFANGLSSSASSMTSNSTIVRKIYFPRLVIPISSVLVSIFDLLMGFVVFVALLIYFQQPVTLHAIYLWPLAILFTMLATIGPGTWLAALSLKYRDFRYVIPFMIQVLFFLTPVIYPVTMLENPYLKYLVALCPMFLPIELFRIPMEPVYGHSDLLLISACSGVLFLVIGVLYFRKTEGYFADLA